MSRAYTDRADFAKTVTAGTEPDADTVLRKQYVSSIKAVDSKASLTRQFIVSTGAVDRDNDAVDPKGWKLANYRKNPVVLFAHDYSSLPIAKCTDIQMKSGALIATCEFADHQMASTVLRLIDGGFLNATSVGFKPLKYQMNDVRRGIDFEEQELLEFSVVPVPANPEALRVDRELIGDVALVKSWAQKTFEALCEKGENPFAPKPNAGDKKPKPKPGDAPSDSDADADAGAGTGDAADDDSNDGGDSADDKPKPKPNPFAPKSAEDIAVAVLRALKGGCECMVKDDHDPMTCSCCKDATCNCSMCAKAGDGEAVAKRGRVLSGKNEAKIRAASAHLDDVLKSMPTSGDGDSSDEEMAIEEIEVKDGEVVFDFDDALDADSVDFDPADLKAALQSVLGDSIRASVQDIIKDTTQATINRMRGRLD